MLWLWLASGNPLRFGDLVLAHPFSLLKRRVIECQELVCISGYVGERNHELGAGRIAEEYVVECAAGVAADSRSKSSITVVVIDNDTN